MARQKRESQTGLVQPLQHDLLFCQLLAQHPQQFDTLRLLFLPATAATTIAGVRA